MALVLTVVLYRRQPPTQPLERRFTGRTVTIGRAAGNDWVLPDPEAHLSKRHCVLQHQGRHWLVTDTSTNGVWVNRAPAPLGAGHSAVLKDGDLLTLGDYDVEIGITADADAAAGAAAPSGATPAVATGAMPPSALPVAPADGGDLAAAYAFLAGAGVTGAALTPETAAETMREAGETFRALAAGLRDLLAARAAMKSDYRLQKTVVRGGDNNPFKFAMDVDQVVAALIAAPHPGYMPPLEAVEQAFGDLRTHELALLAGLQGAVAALLDEFAPETVKERADGKGSVLGAIVPGGRKAKYWEFYEERHRALAEAAVDDAEGVLRRAFARAYEEQAKKF